MSSIQSKVGASTRVEAKLIRDREVPRSWQIRNMTRRGYIWGTLANAGAKAFTKITGIPTVTSELQARVQRLPDHLYAEYDQLGMLLMERILTGKITPGEAQQELETFKDTHGYWVNYGVVGRRVVTDTGVAFLVDDWEDDTTDITTMNFHASGTGVVAEDQTDTDLGAESTGVTDRATGTKSQPAANQLRSVGTQAFTGGAAITEHGLFSVVTESV